jgi:type IV secretion system protein VirB4
MEGTRHLQSEYFLTLVWLPPTDNSKKVGKAFIENSKEQQSHINRWQDVEFFEKQTQNLYQELRSIFNECRLLASDEFLGYLHSTVSTNKLKKFKTPEIPMYLDCLIPDMPLLGGLEPKLGDQHMRIASIRFTPGEMMPAILDALNNLSIEYRFTHRWIPLDPQESTKMLDKHRDRWFDKRKSFMDTIRETMGWGVAQKIDKDADQKVAETEDSLFMSKSGMVSHGYYTGTIVIFDKDPFVATNKIEAIKTLFNEMDFTLIVEQLNAFQAWLGTIPGNTYSNIRMPPINSLNLAHLLPTSAVWSGPEINAHLKDVPLLTAKTKGDTPYRLCTHQQDVGHLFGAGPTGAGKSTHINLNAVQFLRYKKARVVQFDFKMSAFITTKSVGGAYYELGLNEPDSLKLQPLRDIHLQSELNWAHGWVLSLLSHAKVTINATVTDDVWNALVSLSQNDPDLRTITALRVKTMNEEVKAALKAFTHEGPYGYLLDGVQENSFTDDWVSFETQPLFTQPALVVPTLSYLFHAVQRTFKGSPTLLSFDEGWKALDSPEMLAQLKEWLKILRDANVSIHFWTQSLDDVISSPLFAVLTESCPTKIYLPNPEARTETSIEMYRKFGLNDAQIAAIATATKKKHYYYVSDEGCRMYDLDLGSIQLAICGAGGKEKVARAKEILQNIKGTSTPFAVAWLKDQGLQGEADYLQDLFNNINQPDIALQDLEA